MANASELTFGNRLEKARQGVQIVKGDPGYKPDNDTIKIDNLTTFLDSVEKANDTVTAKRAALFDARAARRDAYFSKMTGLLVRAAMARDHVGGLPGGKSTSAYRRFQKLSQKVSNYHAPAKPLGGETGGGSTTQQKRISRSEVSYGSLAQMARDLVTYANDTTGYAPVNANTTAAALGTYAGALEDNNEDVATKLTEAQNAEADRYELYFTKDKTNPGLVERMRLMKSYVAGEFGRNSELYTQLVALKM